MGLPTFTRVSRVVWWISFFLNMSWLVICSICVRIMVLITHGGCCCFLQMRPVLVCMQLSICEYQIVSNSNAHTSHISESES